MTTVYGAWVPNATTSQRMRLPLIYTVPTPSGGDTSVTVTGSVKVGAGFGFYDTTNAFAWSGSLLGSGSTTKNINVATNGEQTIHTFSVVVPLTASPQGKTVAFSLTGIDYVGSSLTASVSATVTIPALPTSAPTNPTGFGTTRVSDARHDLSWSAASSPVSWEIQRYRLSNGTTDYFAVASPGGSARSWSDTASMPNDEIGWRIRAVNAGGTSAWVYSPAYVYTTPAAATGLTVSRSGSEATIWWDINALAAASQTLQVRTSTDGVSWGSWANVSGHVAFSASASSRVVTGLVAGTHYEWRVATTVTSPSTLVAYSAASGSLIPLSAPLAPSLLGPTGVVPDEDATLVTWRHRTADATAQTAAEVRWRVLGGSWTTISGITTAETTTIAAATLSPASYEWQVRTKGQHADYSAWSALATFRVAARPAVSVTAPVTTVGSNRVTLTISYSDAAGAAMTSWRAELSIDGQWAETKTGTGSTTTIPFDVVVADGDIVSANVWATSGTGLTSALAYWTATVDYMDPATPTLSAAWDEPSGTVNLVASNPMGNGTTTANPVSARIDRSLDGGQTWTALADLPLNAGMGDDRVPLNVDAIYRAVSISALGAEAYSLTADVTTTTSRAWLQAEDGRRLCIYHALSMSSQMGSARTLETYLGDAKPTAYYGTARPVSISLSGKWLDEELTQDYAAVLGSDVWYRDPRGRAFWASVEQVSGGEPHSVWSDVSLTVDEVAHG